LALSAEEIEHALDIFAGLGRLTTRKMFGGLAIYLDGVIFSIVMADGRVLLKGQGEMQHRFDELGMERWAYVRPDGTPTNMPYWHLPETALDDPDEAVTLAREALSFL